MGPFSVLAAFWQTAPTPAQGMGLSLPKSGKYLSLQVFVAIQCTDVFALFVSIIDELLSLSLYCEVGKSLPRPELLSKASCNGSPSFICMLYFYTRTPFSRQHAGLSSPIYSQPDSEVG
ncbi:UNVERIFIED_CONTAM: hypothetical protein K2H54_020563 [Gekko kuhli]